MAKKLETGTLQFKRGAGVSRYPWDEWLDGNEWLLTQEEDFPDTQLKFMAVRVRLVGKKRGLRVRTMLNSKEGTLGIQAIPMEEANGEAAEGAPAKKRGKKGAHAG